ncbi:hypothetical protein ABB37_03308 [Leptomonas pyrrhocoris]|uniref:Transmembrane protein n=1 Tax=Leptomonas pyrrhocoris TaxID=157538 RepID=A0A0N0DWY6_LEPPY|nr:hypothetical protein ABB37_03308 [Leptomonas pyrrhocoris]XP_015660622.1 hypothetical protein ABB37_03308 [Leptomonas pyrrhocoris]XP_015660623.1 hypothetical protein ABB37_03308 [Leptomonas pyrrhocoris]KPA82182.1 hypothetical protein ABB37_03308 [Leptomonas pyrrhocoris]KPA82183.1 hypothetical protein ABB37_03308 [Leptomonas pyrrhocoris]KPA82184.1 hypothetical protein ABB37_03308 [Leptomonas pyrrhocoris]|eukprot:XP_015660621.1 hypothetical protein ABB37_03308 [Leptomonas pyrrhocoris]
MMQALRVQAHALRRRGVACSCSSYRTSAGCLFSGGRARSPFFKRNTSVCSRDVSEPRRYASSSTEDVQDNNAAAKEKKEDPASPKEAEGTATASGVDPQEPPLDSEAAAAKRRAAREAIIQEIISRDKVIFELKRQHELSMLRVEQNQARVLKDQEDRGMYYEQNSNVHTFDTISVGLYSQRSTLYHTMSAERLRNVKIFLMVFTTFATCAYLYYRYIINPDWTYVEKPLKMIGSRVQAVREQRWRLLSGDDKLEELRQRDKEYASQHE